jgi:plasmid stabilization system protein ParE
MGRSESADPGPSEGRSFHVRKTAEKEIAEADEYYQEQQEGLGDDLMEQLERTYAIIRQMPQLYAEARPGIRRAKIQRFPSSVLYTVTDRAIVILSVLHQKRDLKKVLARLQNWLERNS